MHADSIIANLDQIIESLSSDKSNDWATEVGYLTRVQEHLGKPQDLSPTPRGWEGYTRPGAPVLKWKGQHRTWSIFEHQGSAVQDKFTVTANPIPSPATDAGAIEGGQFPDMNAAYAALLQAEAADDGNHWE